VISILVPTRGRPQNVARLLDSVFATAAGEVEVVLYVDDDDIHGPMIKQAESNDVSVIVGPRIVLSECWNRCFERARYDVVMQCCDEAVFRTDDWDRFVLAEFQKVPDKIVLVHGRDGIQDAGLATMGFVHRRWVETVDYLCPPYFSCDYNDLWLTEVADALHRRVFLPDVLFEHMHPVVHKAPLDTTHQERLNRGSRDNVGALYRNLAPQRAADVAKLRAALGVAA
jgi:glycosyl transferase/beta-hydroxylase protein BlmF